MGWDPATGAPGSPLKSEGGCQESFLRALICTQCLTPSTMPHSSTTSCNDYSQCHQHITRPASVTLDLSTCTHVFIRRDAVCKALQPPYDGPFKVLKHRAKFFVVLVNSQRQTISIDRVKPAYFEVLSDSSTPELPSLSTPPQVNTPPRTTRSGRHVRFPERFVP